jgi:hypothetical protein
MQQRARFGVGVAAVLTLVLGAVPVAAQQGEMTPEQKAQWDAWMKAMTPGAEHQAMAANVGTWNATVTMWEAPGAPPQKSEGVSKRRMALGGRVMVDEWTGTVMGMPFEGMGTSGYDNAAKKWWGTWTDNMSTGVMTMTGTCDADPKKGCSHVGSFVDPISGKAVTNRSTTVWPSADEERMEMFMTGPDGKEWKNMEIVSKRAPGPGSS